MISKQDVERMCALTELEFKNAEAEAIFRKTAKDCEGHDSMDIVNFAIRWGKCMQYLIDVVDWDLATSAEETQYVCDWEGMSGYTFGLGVRFLTSVWKYGEELRAWHNKQFGYEGKGVVNPAIINIELKEEKPAKEDGKTL